jgi:hypothetical protein
MAKFIDIFSIVFRKVKCSYCQFELSYFRFPKNLRQLLWGGYSCPNCKNELDKFGGKI